VDEALGVQRVAAMLTALARGGPVRARAEVQDRHAAHSTLAGVREELDLDQVQGQVDIPRRTFTWLERLKPAAGLDGPVLPGDEEAERLLEQLDVPAADRADILSARPDPQAHMAYWGILDRLYRAVAPTVGRYVSTEGFEGWPALTTSVTDHVGRHLYVWAYLALLPAVQGHHRERGIPDDISRATLSLAVNLQMHRDLTGHNGLGLAHQWGPPIRLRGAFYRLGRLDYNRAELSFSNGPGAFALSVHIPPLGPLDPAIVSASLKAAREFFPRHYPEEPIEFFTCHSWLLDPQLAEYLPADSNILAFQRRFKLVRTTPEREPPTGDAAILRFVFGRRDTGEDGLDSLPQDTRLQRAFVAHRRSGRHWDERVGWFPFEEAR
jgi:hypothetical protein